MAMKGAPLELSPVHKHMCALKAAGLKQREIAEITGFDESRVSVVLSHPDAEALVARLTSDIVTKMTDDVAAMIQGATMEAHLKNLHLMRNAKSEIVQQRSAFDILDRGGLKPREVRVTAELTLPAEDAKIMRETMEQLGREVFQRPPVDNAVRVLTEGAEPIIGEVEEKERKTA